VRYVKSGGAWGLVKDTDEEYVKKIEITNFIPLLYIKKKYNIG